MNISILIVTNDFEKWIENFKKSFHNEKTIIQKHGTSYYYLSTGKEIEIRFYLTDKVTEYIKINHVVLDEEESRLIQISLIGNEVRKTDNWFNEVYNESKL